MSLENMVLVAAGTLTGLFAGLLYSFSVAVVPGLRGSGPKEHITVMQAINKYIENPIFFLSFFGPIILLPVAAYMHRGTPAFAWLAAAAVIQIVGANIVTIAGNLPLNAKLAQVDVRSLSEAEANKVRNDFQGPGTPWMGLHHVRTLAATVATALVLIACLV